MPDDCLWTGKIGRVRLRLCLGGSQLGQIKLNQAKQGQIKDSWGGSQRQTFDNFRKATAIAFGWTLRGN
jgi:hypothetical protein